jgi:hypothetical protein
MNSEDPKLLNEIRSLRYSVVFAAALIALALSLQGAERTISTIVSIGVAIGALIGGLSSKYLKK